MTNTNQPDFDAIKAKQNATWASGDYAKVGSTLQLSGENLAEALDLRPSSRVLDVAAGNGNATLAFARRWHDVVSTDYVAALLEKGRARAEAEGHDVAFQVADVEDLPFEDASFDAVVSTFGVMFAPNQVHAASEMIRVCRSGGKIGMANWTQDGFIGQLFKVIGGHIAPPAGTHSPARWGDEAWLEEVFGPSASEVTIRPRTFDFRYRSPDHFLDIFKTWYGPTLKAFAALDADGQQALASDILGLVDEFNTATDGSMKVPSAYNEVVVTKA
ncbi:MAG: class I SAM-dependent methyltransferase [Pseudomonadota bacterium]